ncbi:MAG: hypothetical protein ACYC5M_12830 [Anaerolineae bacterium]
MRVELPEQQLDTLSSVDRATDAPASRLTVEVALYGLLLALALLVRLAALGGWPLLSAEADTAVAAWRAARGLPGEPASIIPLLYNANLLFFWLTWTTDASVRVLPALAGSALVVLPFLARDVLGRVGALVAAFLLALAPSWVFFSRTADGAILVAVAGAAALLAWQHHARFGNPAALRVAVVALALGLTAGPGIYTTVAALLVGWLLLGRSRAPNQEAASLFPLPVREVASTKGLWGLGLGVFLFTASGFLLNLGGVGATFALAADWVRSLSPSSSALPAWNLPLLLVTYESLTLGLAVVGVVVGWRRGESVTRLALLWAGLALFLGTVLGHREPVWLLNVLLPLVILATQGAQWLWDHLAPGATLLDGIALLAGLALGSLGLLQLASYSQTAQQSYLLQAGLAWGMVLIVWAAFSLWLRGRAPGRVGVGLLLVLAVLVTVRATTAVAYQTGRDPRERLVHQPTSVQVRDLESLLTQVSSRQVGDPRLLDVDYERTLGSVAAWYLRDYSRARAMSTVDPNLGTTALLTTAREQADWPSGYMGQRFRWRERWPAQHLSLPERIRWFLYRYPAGLVAADEVQFWVRPPTAR